MSLAGDKDTSSSLNSLNIAVNRSISFPSLTSSQSSPTNNIQNSSSRRDYIDFDSDDLIVKITQREFNNSQHTKSCQLVEEIASEKLKRCHSRAFHTENEDQFSRFELSVNRQLYEQYYNSEGPVDFLLVQLVMMMKMGMSFEEMEQVWNSMTSQGSFVRMGKFSSYLDKLTSSSVFKEWSANQFVKEMVKKRWKPQQQQVGSTTSFFNLNANTRPTMMATYNLSQNAIPPSMSSENPKKDDRSQLHEPKYKRFETPLPHPTSSTSNERGKSNWKLSNNSFDLSNLNDVSELEGRKVLFKKYKDGLGYLLVCHNSFHDDQIKDRFCMRKESVDELEKEFGRKLPDYVYGKIIKAWIVDSSVKLGMPKGTKMVSLTTKECIDGIDGCLFGAHQ